MAFGPRRWSPVVGLIAALFLSIGGAIATIVGNGFSETLGDPGEVDAFAGAVSPNCRTFDSAAGGHPRSEAQFPPSWDRANLEWLDAWATEPLGTMVGVPTISRFFGIVITMYFGEHGIPHFHAEHGEHAAVISIAPTELLAGHLPKASPRARVGPAPRGRAPRELGACQTI